uniref:Ig-like domain-containing protein n=1 Tax=Paramormyrops kingsleyae TaxID=1676925 RepID=A0A3B3SRN0_9TELE
MVVSSSIQTKPTVFPLQSCASDTSGGLVDIGCLATGYVPSRSVTFTWRDKGKGSDISDFVQYPEVQRNGAYSVFTQIKVKAEDWEKSNTYTCNANQGQTAESTDVTRMEPTSVHPNHSTLCYIILVDCIEDPITVNIFPPTPEKFFLNEEILLGCKVTGDLSNLGAIEWENADGSKLVAMKEVKENGNSRVSWLSISYEEWSNGTEFVCIVTHSDLPLPKRETYQRENAPSVFILGPAEQAKQVTLTCYAKDFYPKEVLISWLASDEPLDRSRFSTTSLIQTGDTYSVYSQLTIEKDEWDEGKGYSCAVHHETNSKEIKAIVRAIDSLTKKSSSVNLSLSIPQTCKAA